MAWDIWSSCFLKYDIESNRAALLPETSSYRGGLTITLKSDIVAGLAVDANSMYPACMMNSMPCDYVNS